MKYGVIVFKKTENIGDDIQSYAAIKLLPKVDYFVEREHMDLFMPKQQELVKVLMNGWFLHNKSTFFPSPYIDPIFISTHLSSYDTFGITNEHIKINKEYFKNYQPIGCRDLHTQKVLEKYGIENYFSGCVTLTLKPFKIKKTINNYICCVDVSEKIIEHVKNHTTLEVKSMTHTLNLKENVKLSWEERFANVENLLKTYQNAKLVLTSRLHCALPCLALGVPVILIKKSDAIYYNHRLSTFLEYLNYTSEQDFIKSDFEYYLNSKNSDKFKSVRDSIIKDLNKKLLDTTEKLNLPKLIDYKNNYVVRKEKIDYLFEVLSNKYKKISADNLELKHAVKYWKKQYKDLLREKERAIDVNTKYWQNEFNELLNKYNQLEIECIKLNNAEEYK